MNICILYTGDVAAGTQGFESDTHDVSTMPFNDNCVQYIARIQHDVIVLDMMSERDGSDGFKIIGGVRDVTCAPIFLIAGMYGDPWYREMMFDSGVDGCIQSPFTREELWARLNVLLRKRYEPRFRLTTITVGDVTMDIRGHVVYQHGKKIELTKAEYGILFHLFVHRQSVVTTRDLQMCIREKTNDSSSALGVHIRNIRRKIGRHDIIRTVSCRGYTVMDSA